MSRLATQPRPSALVCPLCHDALNDYHEVWTCPGCETSSHLDCCFEMGKCPTLGCEHARRVAPRAPKTPATQSQIARVRGRLREIDAEHAQRQEAYWKTYWATLHKLGFRYLVGGLLCFLPGMVIYAMGDLPLWRVLCLSTLAFLYVFMGVTLSWKAHRQRTGEAPNPTT